MSGINFLRLKIKMAAFRVEDKRSDLGWGGVWIRGLMKGFCSLARHYRNKTGIHTGVTNLVLEVQRLHIQLIFNGVLPKRLKDMSLIKLSIHA